MQIADGRPAHRGVITVDATDDALHLVPKALVLVDSFPAGAGDLDQDGVSGVEFSFLEEFSVGPQPVDDTLRVVEAVDSE